jgi:hypothetical protein
MGADLEEFAEALLDAYDFPGLKQMLFFRLDRELEEITLGKNLREVVFELIRSARKEGWLPQFVQETHAHKPTNERLKRFAAAYLTQKAPAGAGSGEGESDTAATGADTGWRWAHWTELLLSAAVICAWFVNGEVKEHPFPEDALILVKSGTGG